MTPAVVWCSDVHLGEDTEVLVDAWLSKDGQHSLAMTDDEGEAMPAGEALALLIDNCNENRPFIQGILAGCFTVHQ